MDKPYTFIENDTRKAALIAWTSGRILISAKVVKILGLHEGDSVNITTNGEENCLVRVAHTCGLWKCVVRKTNRKSCGGSFCLYSKSLAKYLLRISNATEKVQLAAGEPMHIEGIGRALPLITRNPIR